jgi:hypothetical protein
MMKLHVLLLFLVGMLALLPAPAAAEHDET